MWGTQQKNHSALSYLNSHIIDVKPNQCRIVVIGSGVVPQSL